MAAISVDRGVVTERCEMLRAMVERPAGTVTFLFTDIEGSSGLWEADEVAMRATLERHDELLGDCVQAVGGVVFKHTGDGVCAVFSEAGAAIDPCLRKRPTGPQGVDQVLVEP